MKRRDKVMIGEVSCFFQEMVWTERNNYWNKGTICPVCREPIGLGPVFLLINNHKLFPNCVVHYKCFKIDDPEDTILGIEDDYIMAKKYKHWFK